MVLKLKNATSCWKKLVKKVKLPKPAAPKERGTKNNVITPNPAFIIFEASFTEYRFLNVSTITKLKNKMH